MRHLKKRLNIRFKLKDSYINENNKKLKQKRGTILYESDDATCYIVLFDGTKFKQTYRKDIVEFI